MAAAGAHAVTDRNHRLYARNTIFQIRIDYRGTAEDRVRQGLQL